jgi:hypothetical protein
VFYLFQDLGFGQLDVVVAAKGDGVRLDLDDGGQYFLKTKAGAKQLKKICSFNNLTRNPKV